MSLVKYSVSFEFNSRPSEEILSAAELSMRRPLVGSKLRNIRDMYQSYIPRYQWPRQISLASLENEADQSDMI